jgi:hypothetical protein
MWETLSIVAAVILGTAAVFLIIRRQAKSDSAGCCRNCPYGSGPSDCSPPVDADALPADCDKFK